MIKKKILITGGTGFIGYHLAKKCLSLNWSVTSLSNNKPPKKRKLSNVRYIICDITKKKSLFNKVQKKFDYVVNLAGHVDHSNKKKTLNSHFNGCKNLSYLFINSSIKKFIQIGSCIEYGKKKSPQVEKIINRKTYSTYGKAKLLSTNYLLNLSKKYNFPVNILRFYLVYGPRQDENRLIPITINNAFKNKDFECSQGTQLRDFLYIDDAVSAIIKTLKKKGISGEIINVGSGKPLQVKKVILKICRIISLGKPIFGKIKFRKDEIKYLYPSIKKANLLLNWTPKVKFNLGLKKTINDYKKN